MAQNLSEVGGELDSGNSFDGSLVVAQEFKGPWTLIADIAMLKVTADLDTAGAQVTGFIEFSKDGTDAGLLPRLTRSGVVPGDFTSLSTTTPGALYYRVRAVNTGTITADYCVQSFLQRNPSEPPSVPLFFPLNATSMAKVVRSAITGLPENANPLTDNYVDVKTRADGQLIVAPGARLSQTSGRAHHEVNVVNPTANTTLYTVPAGWDFYVTSARIWGFNTSTASPLQANLRNGAAGAVKGGLAVEESSTGLGGVLKAANITASHQEPVLFTTSVYWQVVQGAFQGSVVLVGYLEPV
ncbi:hypothetical protein [Litorivivens sp.]|uniref:hypothetical protein n=1 Tax=Litorivivens sp. TaxID=2020868 RepID=UPI003561FA98